VLLVSGIIAVALVVATASAQKTASSTPTTVPNLHGVTLTVANFGGKLADAERKAWEIPFEKLTGAKIRDDLVDYAKLKAQVQSGNVSWDVVEADTFFVEQQCGKLFSPRNASVVKSLKNALPGSITNRCGIPVVGSATVLAYDPAKFGTNPPKSWKDFFDTQKYPGKRAVWNYVLNGLPEAALLADGVSPKHLYPLDMNRAFKKLATIKDDLAFYDTLAQQQDAIASGQVVMANIFTGRLLGAIQAGSKFKTVWSQNFRIWDNFAVPKGDKNAAAAMYYLEYMMNPAVQKRLTKYIPYTSMLKGSAPKTDRLTAQYLATSPGHYKVGIDINEHWWAKNYDTMNQKWTDFTSG
jgi:putative spermidine/putrescine transport system substrate-binding protein